VFKNLRTSTKLLLLCAAFVGAIALATYGLIKEKLIAIEFASKELVGAQYLQAMRGVYAVILAAAADGSPVVTSQQSADVALDALAAAEVATGGALGTAELAQALTAAVRALPSAATGDKRAAIVDALTKARDLASRVGDESKLTLDPELDSYYMQNILVKRMPELLADMGELQSLMQVAPIEEDLRVRGQLLDGMVHSIVEEIERDAAAASRGNRDGRLEASIGPAIGAMRPPVDSYLQAADASLSGKQNGTALVQTFQAAVNSVDQATIASQAELTRLLDKRLRNLLGNLYGSLLLNGVVAGLSLLFAALTYRQVVRPLGQLEGLADKVRETKDYGLRIDLDRTDEIGRLASAFNAMLEELAAAREREIADEARNAAMQAELARVARLTTMGEMAASIAHEINQPLASIVNNANAALRWLARQPPNFEEAEAALRRIANDGERGSRIIGSIRAMVKKGDRGRTKVSLNDLIEDVVRLTHSEFQRHGISLRSALADDLPSVMADRVQLQQVMLNLLMNAAEATLPVYDRARLVSVRSGEHDGRTALVEVEDSGTGIEPENAQRIFDAFFTTKAEGMGMGLSICRSIIESHGGRIVLLKGEPHGSVFQVILPTDSA
jgi:signal transduction histidine kinase